MEGRVEGVIFDLGGVLVDWDPMRVYRDVFKGDEVRAAEFLAQVCTPEWNERQDAGRPLAEATAERIALFPGWEAEIRAYYGRWIEMIGGSVPGTANILRELKAAGFRLFALSNWSTETFPLVRYRFQEFDLFDEIFLSGHYGCAKPGERFFRAALERINTTPSSLVFIDDNLRNIAAGAKMGLVTIPFTNADALRQDLRDLGLPLQPG